MSMRDTFKDLRSVKLDFVEPGVAAAYWEMEAACAVAPPVAVDDFPAGNERRFNRAAVKLRILVVLDRNTVYTARSIDISEGGLLITDFCGPDLAPGRVVGVNIRGILSDAGDDGQEHFYLTQVVRHEGSSLALRFGA